MPSPSAAAPEARPLPTQWREIFDAGQWLPVVGSTRVERILHQPMGGTDVCAHGWSVVTPRGPVLVLDDLHIVWGPIFFEHTPATMRVPKGHYASIESRDPVRQARATVLGHPPSIEQRAVSPVKFLSDLVNPDCPPHTSAPNGSRLYAVARVRWAEQLGHPELATRLLEQERELFEDEDGLREIMAEYLLTQAQRALVHGMPRAEVRPVLDRAADLAASALLRQVIERMRDDLLGVDPAPAPAPVTTEWLIAALPEDQYFPHRTWEPPPERTPSWAADEQPRSPAWELVERGWEVLPQLREAMKSSVVRRRPGGAATDEGERKYLWLRQRTSSLAVAVASAIVAEHLVTVEQFERWWTDEGERKYQRRMRRARG